MRIKLCVPYYLDYEFVKPSLQRLLREVTDVEWVDGIRSGAVITLLRNRIVTNFMAPSGDPRTCYDRRQKISDCDALLWVDADIAFEPGHFRRLLAHLREGRRVVSGLYRSRGTKEYVAGWWHADQVGAIGRSIDTVSDEVLEVDWIGAGFSLVAADVYEELELPYYENVVIPFDCGSKVLQVSEDLGFCLKLNQAGIPIHVDASIVVEHSFRTPAESLVELQA